MIQLLVQRAFAEGKAPVFVYPEPRLPLVPSTMELFRRYNELVAMLPEAERYNVFYTVAHHTGLNPPPRLPSRTGATFDYQSVLPFDIDAADPSRALEYGAAVAEVLEVPTEALTVVRSGAGIHVLAHLQAPIQSRKYFEDNKGFYKELLFRLGEVLKKAGLPHKLDPVVFEPARVFRLPGTINRKPGRPDSPCELVQFSDARLEIDLKKVSGMDQVEDENISPAEIRRRYPKPDFGAIIKGCEFIKWSVANPVEVHEPQAFDLFSLLAFAGADATALLDDKEVTPESIGRQVFDGARNSASLAQVTFEEKWDQAKAYGGRKCKTINERWEVGCASCPHWGKIPSPLALKSPDHISSQINGYWVLNSKGYPTHPHYEDLAKVFKREHSYVVTADERIWSFAQTHYEETREIEVKAWLEKTVVPTEPLRAVHRSEFLHKIHAVGVNAVPDEDFFETLTHGKLNLQNGVLNLVTGLLEPHTADIGFKYVLPYAYDANAESEFFLDWLSQITENDPELMEVLLDVMAYCLWPKFDDHVFVYFTGEGSNGKSTLIHLIANLMGELNCSSVGLQALTSNRFAPAELEGKLVNLSEESSGYEVSYEEANALKTLSAGGTMMVEKKNVQGYSFTNRAKLIFSANKRPIFRDQGYALKRRLLNIPFNYTITRPNPGVEEKLIAEIPGIAAMLVRRIQENVKANGGIFKIRRHGATLEQAQREMLMVGNTVVEWAKENLESTVMLSEENYVDVDSMYRAYREWCEQSGLRSPAVKNTFSRTLSEHCITAAGQHENGGTRQRRVNGLNTRIFSHTRYIGVRSE